MGFLYLARKWNYQFEDKIIITEFPKNCPLMETFQRKNVLRQKFLAVNLCWKCQPGTLVSGTLLQKYFLAGMEIPVETLLSI